MKPVLVGSCLCGAVTYQVSEPFPRSSAFRYAESRASRALPIRGIPPGMTEGMSCWFGDGPEARVIKLVPAAFSRYAEQEQRALRALETIRPALLAVPRLAPLPACLELDSAC